MTSAVVFGGGGFLGRRLVGRLTAEGMTVHVVVRHPDPARIAQKLLQYIIDQLAAGVFNRPYCVRSISGPPSERHPTALVRAS